MHIDGDTRAGDVVAVMQEDEDAGDGAEEETHSSTGVCNNGSTDAENVCWAEKAAAEPGELMQVRNPKGWRRALTARHRRQQARSWRSRCPLASTRLACSRLC